MSSRSSFILAGLFGFAGVALGAFGAHALRERLALSGLTGVWDKAVLYHLIHAGMIAAAALSLRPGTAAEPANRWLGRAIALWIAGIVLFSGSLYLLALGAPRWVGPITPLGGLCFLAGWLCLALYGRNRVDTGAGGGANGGG
jgi:uncharacterized membrane protein YgdD (TMEM256/DUF423 family)